PGRSGPLGTRWRWRWAQRADPRSPPGSGSPGVDRAGTQTRTTPSGPPPRSPRGGPAPTRPSQRGSPRGALESLDTARPGPPRPELPNGRSTPQATLWNTTPPCSYCRTEPVACQAPSLNLLPSAYLPKVC